MEINASIPHIVVTTGMLITTPIMVNAGAMMMITIIGRKSGRVDNVNHVSFSFQ